MSLEDMGAVLANERQKRNLTIEDVAAQLKISPRQLRALESGDLASLPHPAYAKGFLRSYAAWLGIGPEEAQRLISLPRDDSSVDAPAAGSPGSGDKPRPGFSGKGVWFLVVLILLCAAGYYAWSEGLLAFLNDKPSQPASIELNLPRASETIASEEPASSVPQQAPEAAAQVEALEPVKKSKPEAPEPDSVPPQPETAQAAAPEQGASAERDAAAAAAPAAHPGQHKLIITALEECWVHSNADRTDTRQFSLRKGDTFALTFSSNLELKLGNAGGVRLRYDGNDLPAPGTSGQVKTLFFPPKEDS